MFKYVMFNMAIIVIGVILILIVPYLLSLTQLSKNLKIILTLLWLIFYVSIIVANLFKSK